MYIYDFVQDEELNHLRELMGAPLINPLEAFINVGGVTYDEIISLRNGGLDIDSKLIKKGKDNTLFYKDVRVTLNIRDINSNSSYEPSLPKIHIAFCQKLEEMQSNGRIERYIVSMESHLIRIINEINRDGQVVKSGSRELNVCKHCLALLGWEKYYSSMPNWEKEKIVNEFNLETFFTKYPQTINYKEYQYLHSEITQPINQYSEQWDIISRKVRESNNWKCQQCYKDFSRNRFLLHVHHKNGLKNDNSEKNLIVLCMECHAQQPYHSHM